MGSMTSRASQTAEAGQESQVKAEPKFDFDPQSYDFFFYGTLCVPAILARVLGHKCEGLTFQDALLPDYTRHCVKGEDYPGLIGKEQTHTLAPKNEVLLSEDVNTRGTFVKGLSYEDVQALDIFEGTEYSRQKLTVQTLTLPAGIDNLPKAISDPASREVFDNLEAEKLVKQLRLHAKEDVPNGNQEVGVGLKEAWVYVWSASLDRLEPAMWTFDTFIKEKAHLWTGKDTTEFDEVERHRAIREQPGASTPDHASDSVGGESDEGRIRGKTKEGYPDFGHGMLKYWAFAENYVNLNLGSYGAAPKAVLDAVHAVHAETEARPDLFMRRSCLPKLNEVKKRVAKLIGADEHECVIVPNATHGINTITSAIDWADGDVIVIYGTTYGAVGQTIKYVCDRNPGVSLENISVTFPCEPGEIVAATEQTLAKYNKVAHVNYTGQAKAEGKTSENRVRMVVVDQISSNPGMVFPWEDIVRLCKRYGALSLVDAAHAIGQVKTDVKRADCDFWVSNCHKWLYAHRGASVMYVPLRNQHLIRSSFPTSHRYESSRYPTRDITPDAPPARDWAFEPQFEWTGTQDFGPTLSIAAALDFRDSIGGEDRIMEYCHTLAVEGGKRVSKAWGTPIMDVPGNKLTAAMVNVALPEVPKPENLAEVYAQLKYFEDELFAANCFAPTYPHAGRWWTRLSAQVFNELSDFDVLADVLGRACEGIRQGKHKQHETVDTDHIHEPADAPTHDE